jgi:hypothetical protein
MLPGSITRLSLAALLALGVAAGSIRMAPPPAAHAEMTTGQCYFSGGDGSGVLIPVDPTFCTDAGKGGGDRGGNGKDDGPPPQKHHHVAPGSPPPPTLLPTPPPSVPGHQDPPTCHTEACLHP